MSKVMSYADWMKWTKGNFTKPRSTLLKAVDSALQQYDQVKNSTNKERTLKALIAWQVSKGNAWKTSVRNKTNTVENLYRQLNDMNGNANELALAHIRKESEEVFIKLFENKQLRYRPGIGKIIYGAGNNTVLSCKVPGYSKNANTIKTVATVGSTSYNAMILAKKIIHNTSEGADKSLVLKVLLEILPDALDQLARSCAPFTGVIFSGGQVVINAVITANNAYYSSNFRMHAQRTLSTGTPEAALKAISRMFDRELHKAEANLAAGLTAFSAKLATTLLDGGTVGNAAVGLIETMAKIIMTVRLIVRDIKERKAANNLIKEMASIHNNNLSEDENSTNKKAFAVKVFEANPLIGAYFVCCVPTSVFVNLMFSTENFNTPGMMDKIERATKRHIGPIKEDAAWLVRKHRMYFPSLQDFPALTKVNKDKLKAMMANNGKSGMVGLGPDDFDSEGKLIG